MKQFGQSDQRGVASLIITMVTMVVISLIVIGFATISRREQRQSLDQQLSTQAFYAAESGIEDAKNVIKTTLAADPNSVIPAKPNCATDPSGKYPTQAKTKLDDDLKVSYTCLTVDPSPTSLQYNGIADGSVVARVNTDAPIATLRLTWTPTSTPATPSTNCPNTVDHTLKQQTSWNCGYGLLRADVTPTTGALNRAGLVGSTVTGFFQPTTAKSSGALIYNASRNTPNLIGANCATASGLYGTCQATITTITGTVTNLAIRLSSLYLSSNVKIEALDSSGQPQKIHGVQAIIDSTGKASDVLRRIQVRLPIAAGGLLPGYALQSNSSICKHFASSDDYFEISGVIDPDPGNAMCQPTTDGAIPVCSAYNDLEFVLDKSESMGEPWQNNVSKLDKMKELTSLFIQNGAVAPDKNHAGITSFSDDATIDRPLGSDIPAIVGAIKNLKAQNGTIYLDGLNSANQDLFGPNARSDAKKVIIFITDGDPRDKGGAPAINALANQLKAKGVVIYTIGISNDIGTGKQVLQEMSGNGGWFGDANQESELDAILKSITLDLTCGQSASNPTPPPPPPPPAPPACTTVNDIAMVLDQSGSMTNKWQSGTAMDQLIKVATKFVKTTQISNANNHAAIVTFSSTASIGKGLTGNQSALLPVISNMKAKGGTVYTAALDEATKVYSSAAIRPGSPKIMVFVSDGAPDESDSFPDNKTGKNRNDILVAAAKIRNSGVRIYTIGINGETYATKRDPYDADLLKKMAGTPSQFFDASSEANLDAIMQQISGLLQCKP